MPESLASLHTRTPSSEGCPGRMVGGRRLHGNVTRRVTYFLRGRKGWYLEETAWRPKAGQLHVEAESPSKDARCAAACSAGEAQRVEEVAPDGVARTRAPFARATQGRVRIVHWTVESRRRLGIGQWTQDCCGCRAGGNQLRVRNGNERMTCRESEFPRRFAHPVRRRLPPFPLLPASHCHHYRYGYDCDVDDSYYCGHDPVIVQSHAAAEDDLEEACRVCPIAIVLHRSAWP